MKRAGVVLWELVVVIGLIAWMGVLGVQLIVHRNTVRYELDLLYRMILSLSYEAALFRKPTELVFVDTHHWSARGRMHSYADGVMLGVPEAATPRATVQAGAPRVRIGRAVSFPQSRVICYPNGAISAGTVFITDTRRRVGGALSSRVGVPLPRRYYWRNGVWHVCH